MFLPVPPSSSSASGSAFSGQPVVANPISLLLNITLADSVAMTRKLVFGGIVPLSPQAPREGWLTGELLLPGDGQPVALPGFLGGGGEETGISKSKGTGVGLGNGLLLVSDSLFDASFVLGGQTGTFTNQRLLALGPGFTNARLNLSQSQGSRAPTSSSQSPAPSQLGRVRFLVMA